MMVAVKPCSIPRACTFAAALTLAIMGSARGEHTALRAAFDSITTTELFDHVGVLADDTLEGRAAGSRGGQAAARYIESHLARFGVAPGGAAGRFAQPFYGAYRNLLARVDGSDETLAGEWIVVGAHYDHVGYGNSQTSYGPIGYIHNGADDNASGVAVLLETIEAFTKLPQPPRRSILFAFWDGEEQGLLGSRHWIGQPTVPLANVRLAINVDMVGRMRSGRLEVGGTRSGYGLRRLLASRSLADGMWLYYDWELKENSDHWPFFERGVPVVLLHTGVHDDYHRPSDDVEKINSQGMRDAATYLFDVLLRAANADELPRFRSAARRETPYAQRERERPLPPLPPRLGVSFRDAHESDLTAPQSGSNPGAYPAAGVVVTSVAPGSPAARSGLQVGDRILQIGDAMVTDGDHFLRLIQSQPVEARLLVVREGETEPLAMDVRLDGRPVRLGIAWRADEAEPTTVYLTRVVPGSAAASAGLLVRDRVVEVDHQRFDSLQAFDRVLKEALDGGEPFNLLIERSGRLQDVQVDPVAVRP